MCLVVVLSWFLSGCVSIKQTNLQPSTLYTALSTCLSSMCARVWERALLSSTHLFSFIRTDLCLWESDTFSLSLHKIIKQGWEFLSASLSLSLSYFSFCLNVKKEAEKIKADTKNCDASKAVLINQLHWNWIKMVWGKWHKTFCSML